MPLTESATELSIPSDLSLAKVKKAILRFAETEDEEYALHPEGLVTCKNPLKAIKQSWQLDKKDAFVSELRMSVL